jgi:nucleotide-binding universal stress UspA family protein
MPRQSALTISRILVATDFSSQARLALDWAECLSQSLEAKIVLLHVVDIFSLAQASCRMVGTDYVALLREEAIHDMEEAHKLFPAVECLIREGSPRPVIIDTAIERDCQMIVMGTHGRSGLAHILLGSVAEYVVRHSPIPVLIVRGPKDGER